MNSPCYNSFLLSMTLLFSSLSVISQGAELGLPDTESALCLQASHSGAPFVEDGGVCDPSGNRFGATLVVGRNNKIIYEESIGAASSDGSQKVVNNSLFRVASIHKPITAIAIMKLVENGQLSLNDQVFGVGGIINDSDVLSEIPSGSTISSITVDHLLRHTSGWSGALTYVPFSLRGSAFSDAPNGIAYEFDEQNRASLNTMVKYMARQVPVVTPGTRYNYNNMNYHILNRVIEKVSNIPYEDYLKTTVFDPLGIWEIKPAKTFLADKYDNEVEYIWPSVTEVSNLHPSYCSNRKVASQYGFFRHEGMWIASARALTRLFMAIDKNSNVKILGDSTIDAMFNTISIPNQVGSGSTNVARGWIRTAMNNSNQGDWSFVGEIAGSKAEFKKSDGNLITYLRNATQNKQEPSDDALWKTSSIIESVRLELSNIGGEGLNAMSHISRNEWNGEWKPGTVSEADVQAGCHSYRVSSFLFN